MERGVTQPEEVEASYDHSGVVLFIIDKKGRVLVTRERNNKETAFERGTLRKPDQLGVITETREPGENWQSALLRGIKEELGFDDESFNLLKVNKDNSYIGETLFRDGTLGTVVQIYCPDIEKLLKSIKPSKDVDVLGFLSISFLKRSGNIRYGVDRVINECLDFNLFTISQKDNYVSLNKESLGELRTHS